MLSLTGAPEAWVSGGLLISSVICNSPRDTLTLVRASETVELPVRPVLRTNNAQVITNTLLSGKVAGPVQHLLISDELKNGRLVRVLPEYEVRSADIFMAYPSVKFMRPAVRAFADFVVPAIKAVDGVDVIGYSSSQNTVTPHLHSDEPRGRAAIGCDSQRTPA
ncbi:LysR substrate-binding domain-containing protein [Sinorhizobium sp. 7-81]|uniref:LysR substrate-binding domain-containing protein n=1 Tax=Sinorhizobium sp. 8-89 TaxID=3049089 RepID=UPI0024C27794|nr:LysR substrate-binding domain-containing protein [Sinorhizobium sp. 8-89]MDK1494199.1 LysR substrate-binding domain-containing protein [Sinorhizobium sp. 8-89]